MKAKHLVILLGFLILPPSCICNNRKIGNVYLLPAHQESIPYKKGDICSYIDKKGNTIRFFATKQKHNKMQVNVQEGGACSDYFVFEEEVITLKSELNNSEIGEINLINSIDYEYDNNWQLQFDNNISRLFIFLGSINNYPHFKLKCNQDGKFLTNHETFFYKTIEINNKIYGDVIEHRLDDKNSVFYNHVYGILKLTQSGEDILIINR